MKKTLLTICAFLIASFTFAQSPVKLGHINSQELLQAMPESDSAQAKLEKVDGKKLFFTAKVWDETGLISESSHERFIVNVDKFMNKARSDINEK